jgi:hypothetical protein
MLNSSLSEEGHPTNICEDIDLSEWKSYFFTSNCNDFVDKYGIFRIIKKVLSDDERQPNLVVMAGFSTNSFCGTTKRVIENLDKIVDKFKAVYILKFDEDVFKDLQKNACQERDSNKHKMTDYKRIYSPETNLNEDIGTIVDKLLRCAGLSNVHLLGKCAGGGVAIHTFTKSNIYNALYLGVPASPTNIEHLIEFNFTNKIIGKKFIFGWDTRDAYPFDWGRTSNHEKYFYDETIEPLKSDNLVILEEFEAGESHPKNYHEVPNGLFDLIRHHN